jgi:hypothetical protein
MQHEPSQEGAVPVHEQRRRGARLGIVSAFVSYVVSESRRDASIEHPCLRCLADVARDVVGQRVLITARVNSLGQPQPAFVALMVEAAPFAPGE